MTLGQRTLAAVIGQPVRHSLSPVMHNSAFGRAGRRWHYFAAPVDPGSLAGVMRAVRTLAVGGLSVTTPLKEAVIDHLDVISEESRRLRSVNCVTMKDGLLVGDVTDGQGCLDALRGAGADPGSSTVALLGAGPTARVIASALCGVGASVVVINRTAERAAHLCDLIRGVVADVDIRVGSTESVRESGIVVNASTVGMDARADDESLVDPSFLSPGQYVMDAVYQPLETPLLRDARRAGAVPVDGLWMLVHQAVRQHRLWFGDGDVDVQATIDAMRSAAERELALRRR